MKPMYIIIAITIVLLVGAALIKPSSSIMYLASSLDGQLVSSDGSPVPGHTLTRTITWHYKNDKVYTQEATTDEAGNFSFPALTDTSFWARIVPHTPSILQVVTVQLDNETKTILEIDKGTYDEDSEAGSYGVDANGKTILNAKKMNLVCNLDAEANGDGFYWGTCVQKD